jgi:hypothetical protein
MKLSPPETRIGGDETEKLMRRNALSGRRNTVLYHIHDNKHQTTF